MAFSESGIRRHFEDERVIVGCPWAYDAGFSIDTVEPSRIVREVLQAYQIPDGSNVLDLGCGRNARNAIYLAHQHNCNIDAFDLDLPDYPKNLPFETAMRINFNQGSVLDFDYEENKYQIAILARLIQYLSPQEVELLLSKVDRSLRPEGIIALSYTAEGGIHNKTKDYGINTFMHSIENVQGLLSQRNFSVKFLKQGASESTHVPHSGEKALTYDLFAQKHS